MSGQSDFNNFWEEYILYNVNYIQGSPTAYPTDCSTICTTAFDDDNNIAITSWLIGPEYVQPSNDTLIGYELDAVTSWYNGFYVFPANIAAYQPFHLTSAQLAGVRTDPSMIGMTVFDTTINAPKYFNGATWLNASPSQFLPLSGGAMAGGLNMGGNAITSVSSVLQSIPSAISIWSGNSLSVSFTNDVAKIVAMTGFAQTVNPAGDFTMTATTGQIQYLGASARYFRVKIYYGIAAPAVSGTETLTHFIAIGGSTSFGQCSVHTFVPSGPTNVYTDSISDVVRLATGDTLQLGAKYSATASLVYSNMSYSVTQL